VTGTAAAAARTSEPLAAIARRCGFASAETFRQAFVAWAGVPPSRFRAAER
jgi:AraC-like DNA-binding protein